MIAKSMAIDWAFYPEGVARQVAAAIAKGDRRPSLQQVKIPTLLIHGTIDLLIPVSCGIDTKQNIPNAELLLIDSMGHYIPVGVWEQIVYAITKVISRLS